MDHPHNTLLRYLLVAFLALPLLLPPASSAGITPNSPHGTLEIISKSPDITYVTIYNPPINLYDKAVAADLYEFVSGLDPANRTTPPPKVVIFRSADPDFFIAHLDLRLLLPPITPEITLALAQYRAVTRLFQSLTTTIFIAEVDGIALGAGNEPLVQMDMRFAGPKARVGSIESSFGVTHGVGGLQFLARLINKARAAQYLLSGDTADCKTGKELGWFNDCYRSRKAMEKAVGALAERIAVRPAGSLNATKVGLQALNPPFSVLDADLARYAALASTPAVWALLEKFLVLGGNQTRTAFELGLDATIAALYV